MVQEELERTQAAMRENQRLRALLQFQQSQPESFLPPLPSSAPPHPQLQRAPLSASPTLSLPSLLPRNQPPGLQRSPPVQMRVRKSATKSPSHSLSPPFRSGQTSTASSSRMSPQRRRKRKIHAGSEAKVQTNQRPDGVISGLQTEQCMEKAVAQGDHHEVRQYLPTVGSWLTNEPVCKSDNENCDVIVTPEDLVTPTQTRVTRPSMRNPGNVHPSFDFIGCPSAPTIEKLSKKPRCSSDPNARKESAQPMVDKFRNRKQSRYPQDSQVVCGDARYDADQLEVSEHSYRCTDFDELAADIIQRNKAEAIEYSGQYEVLLRESRNHLECDISPNLHHESKTAEENPSDRFQRYYEHDTPVNEDDCHGHYEEFVRNEKAKSPNPALPLRDPSYFDAD